MCTLASVCVREGEQVSRRSAEWEKVRGRVKEVVQIEMKRMSESTRRAVECVFKSDEVQNQTFLSPLAYNEDKSVLQGNILKL